MNEMPIPTHDFLASRLEPFRGDTLGVLMGGYGGEREVSLRSGENVAGQLESLGLRVERVVVGDDLVSVLREKGITLAVNMLHGTFGEDGRVQSILEFLKIPYTGEGVGNSALCMNKVRTKEILAAHHVKTAPHMAFAPLAHRGAKGVLEDMDLRGMTVPLVLKPVEGGSSVGVVLLSDRTALKEALERLEREKNLAAMFVETQLRGREITVGLYREGAAVRTLPILELRPKKEFYDYEAKYTAGLTEMILPAPLERTLELRVKRLALQVYEAFPFDNVVRIDMIIEREVPHILEINTQPGMTATSDIPAMVAAAGIPMGHFLAANLENARRPRF